MKVGVLGSGMVGQALGKGFAGRGHDVKLGSRSPGSKELSAWRTGTEGKASTGTFAEAAKHGDLLVLAALGSAVDEVLKLAGPQNFAGKILIDASNPLDHSAGGPPGLFVGLTDSLGERVQRALPKAKVVKCFNTVPSAQMVDPKFSGGSARMLICGNDADAKRQVTAILKEFGWPGAIDVGGIDAARWLEAMVPLWVRVGGALNRWDHAFSVIHG